MYNTVNSLLIILKISLKLSAILLLFVAISYATNKTIKQPKTDDEFMDNKKIAQNVVEKIFNQKNIGEIDKLFRKDYVYHHPFGPSYGNETIKAQVIDTDKALSGFNIDAHEIMSEKNLVATRFTASGKHVGSFMGLPATGNYVKITGIIISRIENGMIAEEWEFADLIGVRQQLDADYSIPINIIPLRTKPEDFSWGQPLSETTFPSDSENNKSIVSKMVENLSDSKVTVALFNKFSREFHFHAPSLPDLKTFNNLKKYWRKINQTTQSLFVSIDDLIAERDLVAFRWSCQFIHIATDKQALTKGVVIFKIADGKIIEGWLSADLIGLLQQIGLFPSPPK